MARARVVFPLPVGPAISVSRPRGSPPPSSTASSAATPVGSAGVGGGGGGRSLTSPAIDRGMWGGEGGIRPLTEKQPKRAGQAPGKNQTPPGPPGALFYAPKA